ncbi:MAG: phenylalanine--tRNA ligase subunit alpha [Pelagibacterales bacterium]|nr:phenylalanine--tRNA ligase subunit alpha [Pelagibacterales bacterium]
MQKKYSLLISTLKDNLAECDSLNKLVLIKSQYLGKQGKLTLEFGRIKDSKISERKELGRILNDIKMQISDLIDKKSESLASINKKETLNFFDVTLPGRNISSGSRHPISITISTITKILNNYGFISVSGPEIENEFYNFEALNIPASHPARDMHDTFYVTDNKLLRTHTSSVQIHTMLANKPPLRIMTPGKVYRCDSDPTHSPMFHQIEGLCIDKDINFCQLKGLLINFIEQFFGKKMEIRFRPSYFPFTEPSAEIDIKFNNKWLEVLGCGIVHPNVLKNVKINHNQYSGFAFGLGIERLAMLKYGITDLRIFYDNDISFLSQFSVLK